MSNVTFTTSTILRHDNRLSVTDAVHMNLRAKDKKQKRRVSLEERRENVMAAVRKWEMLAAAKVKIIGSEKNKRTRIHATFPP